MNAKKAVKKAVKKVAKKAVKKAVKPRGPVIPKRIYDAVDRGIQFLDLMLGRKEWLSRMELGEFDIKDPGTCVAGSVWRECYDFDDNSDSSTEDGYDRFCAMLEVLGGSGASYRLGFNVNDDYANSEKEFQHLQDVWVRSIQLMKKRTK